MTPDTPSHAVMNIFLFSVLGLGLLGQAGCRSSHSDTDSSRQLSVGAQQSVAPAMPSPRGEHDLPPSPGSKPVAGALLGPSSTASSDRLTAATSEVGCGPCGSNSPAINAFPFNGLHVDGRANADGDRLLVDSFDRGTSHCDAGHTDQLFLRLAPRSEVVRKAVAGKNAKPVIQNVLVVGDAGTAGYELVATDGSEAAPRCRGPELAGATFEVSSERGWSAKLLISHVAETSLRYATVPRPAPGEPVSKFFLGLSKNRDRLRHADKLRQERSQLRDDATEQDNSLIVHQKRTVYLITRADHPNESLCTHPYYSEHTPLPFKADYDGAPYAMPRVYLGHPLWRVMKDELASYAVIIPGTVFDNKGDAIARSGEPGWFNIACAADALAETDLSGLVPPPAKLDEPETNSATALRLPALHMFSAKYAGGVSATNSGTPISWKVVWQSKTSLSIDLLHQELQQLQDGWLQNREISSVRRDDANPAEPASPSQPDASAPDDHPKVEARWNAQGAACLCHSRIWMSNRVIPVPEQAKEHRRGARNQAPTTLDLRDEAKFNGSLGTLAACDVTKIEQAMAQPQPWPGLSAASDPARSPELISFVLGHADHDPASNPDPCPADQPRGN